MCCTNIDVGVADGNSGSVGSGSGYLLSDGREDRGLAVVEFDIFGEHVRSLFDDGKP